MRKNHKKNLWTYREKTKILKILNLFILTSVDWSNLIYLKNQSTIFQKLSALKNRLASTNRIKELEIIQKYKNLQRISKYQQLDQYLLNWEKIYAKTKRLNLSNVQKNRCAYDFLNSLRRINTSFVIDKKIILNHEMNQNKSLTLINFFERISKSFANRASINRKKNNSWNIYHIARKIEKKWEIWSRK